MKKILAVFGVSTVLFVGTSFATGELEGYINKADDIFKILSGAILPTDATNEFGSSSQRIAKIWTDDLDATVATVGGISSGALAIDVDDAEALLVRKDGDAGDIFVVDTVGEDVYVSSSLGIGTSSPTSSLHLPQENDASTPTLSFGDGDTGFYESADDELRIAISGTAPYVIDSTRIQGANANGFSLSRGATSDVIPVFLPRRDDVDSGIGSSANDQLSLIAGGVEGLRIIEDTTVQAILPLQNDSTKPSLAFGDGDTGFFEEIDDVIRVAIGGTQRWAFSTTNMGSANLSDGPFLLWESSTATNPVYTKQGDVDTGVGYAADDQLSLIAGGLEGQRITETTAGNNSLQHILNAQMGQATGDEVAYSLDYTTNKATSGADTGLLINMTGTDSPGASWFLDMKADGDSKVLIGTNGAIYLDSTIQFANYSGITSRANNNTLLIQTRDYTSADNPIEMLNGTEFTNTTGSSAGLAILPTYNQASGDGANTDLLINRTETDVGSGNQFLFDAQADGDSKFVIENTGNVGIGTSNPSSLLHLDNGSGWGQITADGSSGGCQMFRDTDDSGWTECSYLNGIETCSIDADGICDGS